MLGCKCRRSQWPGSILWHKPQPACPGRPSFFPIPGRAFVLPIAPVLLLLEAPSLTTATFRIILRGPRGLDQDPCPLGPGPSGFSRVVILGKRVADLLTKALLAAIVDRTGGGLKSSSATLVL